MKLRIPLNRNEGEFNIEQRVHLPGVLRFLPFGLGYEVVNKYPLRVARKVAQNWAEKHKGERNEAGWPIETVVVRHREGSRGKERG